VIIDRFAGDRQLFWVYGRDNPACSSDTDGHASQAATAATCWSIYKLARQQTWIGEVDAATEAEAKAAAQFKHYAPKLMAVRRTDSIPRPDPACRLRCNRSGDPCGRLMVVGSTSGVHEVAADLSRRLTRQPRAVFGHRARMILTAKIWDNVQV
jgi:hypothetical protein